MMKTVKMEMLLGERIAALSRARVKIYPRRRAFKTCIRHWTDQHL
jgi:hypothetical protein